MHFYTATQCCNEIEDLLRIADLPTQDALLRLMVAEKRLRRDFCRGAASQRLRSLIEAIERFWTVGMFPPVEGESAMLQASALRELDALRCELESGRGTDSANDSLMAA